MLLRSVSPYRRKRESSVSQNVRESGLADLAQRLLSRARIVGLGVDGRSVLRLLEYDIGDAAAHAHRACLLDGAARLRQVVRLPVPDAPAMVFFAGIADPGTLRKAYAGESIGYLAGSGLSVQRAFEACVGEGIEYLSQFISDADPLEPAPGSAHVSGFAPFIAAVLSAAGVDESQTIAWVPARALSDGAEAWFPADLCYRRPPAQQDFVPPLKLSTGCAAGPTIEAATVRALLELIERDAAALWWHGGRRARPIPDDSDAGRTAAELLMQLRGDRQERRTWLLDITTDIDIPSVAAVSARADGFGFCYGLGARLTLAEAATAALFELCQVELGQHVVAAKLNESGEAALNDSDRRQLRRGTLFDTSGCALLRPEGAPRAESQAIPPEPGLALPLLVERLARLGAIYRVDLTRELFGVPVVRVLAPWLQMEPCSIVGPRLARTIAATGGGAHHTGGLPLL
ncbi:MAG TPA: YcaO-like family protein [Acetobacteraceae bacterium]|nr:YcaO-like family protein [Acetobacteraceae bacterium]